MSKFSDFYKNRKNRKNLIFRVAYIEKPWPSLHIKACFIKYCSIGSIRSFQTLKMAKNRQKRLKLMTLNFKKLNNDHN